jgi:GT2 family glycosyltransferase
MKTCAVVILNWNGAGFLKKFLPVLLQHTTFPYVRIIVADNASTDNSLELLSSDFPSVEQLVLDRNYGFAGGYNKALAQVDASYYVLLNSDVEVTEGWLQPLLAYLEDNADVAAAQPKIRAYHQPAHFEHAGAAGGFIDSLGYPFCRGRILSVTEADTNQYDTVRDVFWASGACMLIRSEVYRNCGGLDDDFFAHMEEIDLCWRIHSRGYRIVAIPGSVVYHVGGGTLSVESPRKTYLNFRNNLLMLYKNLPENRLKKVLWLRLGLDLLAALHLLLTGNYKNARAVLQARIDYRRMKNDFLVRRAENLSKVVQTDLPGVYAGSILLAFYLKGKRKFSGLF